jgi:sugar phosphate isomerase/epimerase
MKLGFLTAILDGWSFEETVDIAAEQGYSCIEVCCWPKSGSDRRYAGTCHIDVTDLDDAKAEGILKHLSLKGVGISALAYYPNPLDGDTEKRSAAIKHLMLVIDAASRLGIGMVNTFVGRDQYLTVERNLEIFAEVWPPIIRYAEAGGVRIAIENCPMLFGPDQWPGGQNLASSPAVWRRMFEIIPSASFGINYDPSHFIWQMIDYIEPIYEFRDRIFHVHVKDAKLLRNRLRDAGIMAYPLDYMTPKLPGLGDVDWGRYISALSDIGFDGCVCVEVEDRAFESTREKRIESLTVSARYMRQFVI